MPFVKLHQIMLETGIFRGALNKMEIKRNVKWIMLLFVFVVSCTSNNRKLYGTYERKMEMRGCTGIERIKIEKNKLLIRTKYDDSKTGQMHLDKIEFGKRE
jgi:hypothetical protein